MNDKLHRFQRILDTTPALKDMLEISSEDFDVVADALNYIGLSLSEDAFMRVLCRIWIYYTKYNWASMLSEKRVIQATTTINHEIKEYQIGYSHQIRRGVPKISLRIELQMNDRNIVMEVSSNQYEPTMYRAINIICTRSSLYTSEITGLALSSLDHGQALTALKDDIEEGITKYLEAYILNNKEEINAILEICNKNQWNELTMMILRICEESGIRSESELRL